MTLPPAAVPRTAAAPAGLALPDLRERLWTAVSSGDEDAAVAVAFTALDHGVAPETVLLDVVARTQERVGAEWAAGRLTVAGEHTATAIDDRVIAALARHPAARAEPAAATDGDGEAEVVVACVDGEWHALPARLLAEVLRLRGRRVAFLGAQIPTPHLVAHLHQHDPAAVALSCSLPTRLPAAHGAIAACRAVGVPVIAGGPGFGAGGRYARLLGADAWAPDARAAAEALRPGLDRPLPGDAREPVDDLPHLADQEYTMVARTVPALVRDTLAAETAGGGDPDPLAAEEVATLVEFLAAALYVDDPDLFAGYVRWQHEIAAARGTAPAAGRATGTTGTTATRLDALAGLLTEFPRAARTLAAAHDHVR